MEDKIEHKIKGWKITLFVTMAVGLFWLLVSAGSEPQNQTSNITNNQVLGTRNSSINPLPINSPTPNKVANTYKPSSQSLIISAYIFANAGSQKNEWIKKFASGKNDQSVAINNLAIILDKNPQLNALVWAAILDYSMKQGSRNSARTTLEDIEDKIDDLQYKIDEINDAIRN